MFIDEIKVSARAGHGGKGSVAFHREAFVPKGGPSGGNGGRGGSVILQADHDLNNLIQQYYVPRLFAEDGNHGLGKGMEGRGGKDLIVKVPCGTLVWLQAGGGRPPEPDPNADEDTDDSSGDKPKLKSSTGKRPLLRSSQSEDLSQEDGEPDAEGRLPGKGRLIADLVEHGQQFVLCKGGRGGLGNKNFATARRQTPRFAQPGESGEEGEYLFELRLMAEIGIVGYPNAGKSTLLTAISKARPKIAPYPFTTLTPQVGILEYPDFKRLTVCDVPGLIDGAHQNVGLGHSFLRHIQRCKILVILLDMAGTDNRKPWDDYKSLLKELELYNPEMLEKPRLVVANKMDEAVAEEHLKLFKKKIKKVSLMPISAAFDQGVEQFKLTIRKEVEKATGS